MIIIAEKVPLEVQHSKSRIFQSLDKITMAHLATYVIISYLVLIQNN